MKINNSNPSTVPFSSIEVGGIFEHCDNIYIRIPEISRLLDERPTYVDVNAYDLTNNSCICFSDSVQVTPYPNATLNLVP